MFISRKGIEKMELYVNSQVQTIRRVVVAILDIKSKEIQSNLNLSKSVVSRHLRGERDNVYARNKEYSCVDFA